MVSLAVPNRIDAPGTAEAAWRAWPTLRGFPVARVGRWASVVVIAAHPDDEILGAGGTIALLARAGARLRLVAVTDGDASHPRNGDPAELARRRTAESAAALKIVGADRVEVIRLRLPDTGLADREDELAGLLRPLCAGFDVCLAPWEDDAHADHEAAGRAARRAAGHVLRYPIWMWHWAAPDDERVPWDRCRQIPLPPDIAAAKHAAIQAFTSQLTGGGPSGAPVLPAGIVAHFTRAQEVFFW
jgi:LmbE family N-acetylglucosaminyl deacetylase